MKSRLSLKEYTQGILNGDRVVLAQAITLLESDLPADETLGTTLLESILERTGNSIRIGITGVPGVGKSTFIEAFGKHIISQQKKLAVLTIDPSSQLTRGSILGDKTRMEDLSKNPAAFIRPSASGKTLGGVAHKTRETILLCEAAGYDVIVVETVGVGQSEVSVRNMVDFFLLLMLAGAGDELQGIKKGIMEMADGIAITKADGDNIAHAKEAQAEYKHALHLFAAPASGFNPPVMTCSSVTNIGIQEIWETIGRYEKTTQASGYFTFNREQQHVAWFHEHFEWLIKKDFRRYEGLQSALQLFEEQVRRGKLAPPAASQQLLIKYQEALRGSKS